MNERAARPVSKAQRSLPDSEAAREISGYWWLWLVAGIAWIVISAVILQFDEASITTVGILVGLMFMLASIQNLAFSERAARALERAGVSGAWRWVSGLFAVLFLIAAVICFISPENTLRRWRTPSGSCSCSSACGGSSGRSWNGRSTQCGGSG